MIKRSFWISMCLFLGYACSGVQAPKERILRSDKSYEKDLTQLQEYLGVMPVDMVVEGYRPTPDGTLSITYSKDSVEATITQATITQLSPEYTYVRSRDGSAGSSIRIPTKNVTRIHAEGARMYRPSRWSGFPFTISVVLGVLAIVSAALEGKVNDGSGCQGGCLALGIILGAAALLSLAVTVLLLDEPSMTFELISKVWSFQ